MSGKGIVYQMPNLTNDEKIDSTTLMYDRLNISEDAASDLEMINLQFSLYWGRMRHPLLLAGRVSALQLHSWRVLEKRYSALVRLTLLVYTLLFFLLS
jgi:hypothetical protein